MFEEITGTKQDVECHATCLQYGKHCHVKGLGTHVDVVKKNSVIQMKLLESIIVIH